METLLDAFLEIDAKIGGIIFFMGLLITFYIQGERNRLFGATVGGKKTNKSLVAPGS
jgi:hypothetical protein